MKTLSGSNLLFVLEILVGALTGVVFAYFAYLVVLILGAWGEKDYSLLGFLIATLAVYPLGVGMGNYVFNRRFRNSASFWGALMGSAGGILLVFLLDDYLDLIRRFTILFEVSLGAMPPVFAAVFMRIWASFSRRT